MMANGSTMTSAYKKSELQLLSGSKLLSFRPSICALFRLGPSSVVLGLKEMGLE